MSSLRELLDKQKAEKDAFAAGTAIHTEIAEKGLTLAQTFDTQPVPQEPPKKRSVLDRIGNSITGKIDSSAPGINDDPMAAKRAIYLAEQKLAEIPIVVTIPASPQDLPQSSIEELRKNLDFLAENIDQKSGLVGQVVRTIGQQLYENPQFSSCMKDPDFDLLVRGLRRSFNIAARRRVEAGEKKEERREEVLELENMMKDLGVSLKF